MTATRYARIAAERAGIYTFTAGRLNFDRRASRAGSAARGAKSKKKPAA